MGIVQLRCRACAFAFRFLEGEGNSLFAFVRKGLLSALSNGQNQKREKYDCAHQVYKNFHTPNVRAASGAFNIESAAYGCASKSAPIGPYNSNKPAMNSRWLHGFAVSLENSLPCINLIASKQEDRSWLTIRPSRRRAVVSGSSFLPEGLSLFCYMPFLQGAGQQPSTPRCYQNKRQAERKQLLGRQASRNTTHTSSKSGGYFVVSTAFSVFKGGFSRNVFTSSQTEYPEGYPC